MPECSLGTTPTTSAVAAETVPVNTPCKKRRIASCWTLVTQAIITIRIAPAKVARSTISLRPYWSANVPQMGAMMAKPNDIREVAKPAHNATCCWPVTPSSWM